jgi:uncharacterized membrane protein YheB (UPF0754 family)
MKNTIFNFNTIVFGDFAVHDFAFQKKIYNLLNLTELNDLNYIDYIQLENNQTFDMVSDILYDTTDYWDLLSSINEKNPLFDIAFSDELFNNYGTQMANLYEEKVSEQKLSPEIYNMLKDRFSSRSEEINEGNRIIKVIKPEKLSDFLKILRDNNIII